MKITSFRSDVIRPQEARHGAIFAIMEYVNANERNHGTNTIAEVICHGDKLTQGCLVQCRGTNNDEIDNMSRHKSLKAGRCGNPGIRFGECIFDAETSCKNCDKKITTTVRVSGRTCLSWYKAYSFD